MLARKSCDASVPTRTWGTYVCLPRDPVNPDTIYSIRYPSWIIVSEFGIFFPPRNGRVLVGSDRSLFDAFHTFLVDGTTDTVTGRRRTRG